MRGCVESRSSTRRVPEGWLRFGSAVLPHPADRSRGRDLLGERVQLPDAHRCKRWRVRGKGCALQRPRHDESLADVVPGLDLRDRVIANEALEVRGLAEDFQAINDGLAALDPGDHLLEPDPLPQHGAEQRGESRVTLDRRE